MDHQLMHTPQGRLWRLATRFGFKKWDLVSPGLTGEEWIKRFPGEHSWDGISARAQEVLRSPAFVPHPGKIYRPVVIWGHGLAHDNRTVARIRGLGNGLGYSTPPVELAILLRAAFSDNDIEAMGEDDGRHVDELIVIHDAINFPGPTLLTIRRGFLGRALDTCLGATHDKLPENAGYVFIL